MLFLVISASGYVLYKAWSDRHPNQQVSQDPSKKTIVVLGNGWGATSFLKGLDTEDYNVVSLLVSFRFNLSQKTTSGQANRLMGFVF